MSYFKFEKDVGKLVLSGNSDDLMGVLTPAKREALSEYRDALIVSVKAAAERCEKMAEDVTKMNWDRKAFSLNSNESHGLKAIIFRHFDNLDGVNFLSALIATGLDMTKSFSRWDQFKSSIGFEYDWEVGDLK